MGCDRGGNLFNFSTVNLLSNLFNFSRPIYLRSIDIEIYLIFSPCFPRPIDLTVSRPIYLAMTSSPRVRRALIRQP